MHPLTRSASATPPPGPRSALLLLVAGLGLVATLALHAAGIQDGPLWAWNACIVAALAFNATAFYTRRSYLFSAGFWTALFFIAYFVLKSTEFLGDSGSVWITAALQLSAVFLVAYNAGQAIGQHKGVARAHQAQIVDSLLLARACLLIFVVSRVGYTFAVRLVLAGDYTQLDIAAMTQNQGMAYVFKAFAIGHLALLLLLIMAFRDRKHRAYALCGVLLYLVDVLANASRSGLIIFVLSLLFLRHRFVKVVPWLWLVLLAPPLVFVVSFFGYVRDVEVGSLAVYVDALRYFIDDGQLVWQLFMGRLDVMPNMAEALQAHQLGELPNLWGSSYVDMFLHWIPRNLWADKPPLTSALVSAVTIPGAFDAGVLIYPTMPLEAYLNFDLPGVVLAGLVTGLLAAGYDRWRQGSGLYDTFYFLVFFTFPMGLIAEGFHSNFLATAIYTGALSLVLTQALQLLGAVRRDGRRARQYAAIPAPAMHP